MKSEAVSALRNWAKDRLGEQEELLRSVERSIARLAELDHERTQVIDTIGASIVRLGELGLDEQQVAAFVGLELAALRAGRPRPASAVATRRTSAAPVNVAVLS